MKEAEFLLTFAGVHEGKHSRVLDLIEVFAAITTPVRTTGALYHHLYGAWGEHEPGYGCGDQHKRCFLERARTHRAFIIKKRPEIDPSDHVQNQKSPKRTQALYPILHEMIDGTEFYQSAGAIGRLTRLRLITPAELSVSLISVAVTMLLREHTPKEVREILKNLFPEKNERTLYRWTAPPLVPSTLMQKLRLSH